VRRGRISVLSILAVLATGPAIAQTEAALFGAPVGDDRVYVHGLLDQLEGRLGSGVGDLRWDGEAWLGTDTNRLWLKAEGERDGHGALSDGRVEALYSRPITTYFDAQAGIRLDLDSRPGRTWAALGFEGLAPYLLKIDAAAYVSGDGRLAGRSMIARDLLITQRLILSPEVEVDLYSQDDPRRRLGSGLADLDAGLRFRYEITRKFAPYLGVVYEGRFGRTADFARAAGEPPGGVKFTIGLRGWF
jgi:copper resistance protein B